MSEATVKTSTGEFVEFTDGTTINRQRPKREPINGVNYTKIIPVQTFKDVFKAGQTKSQVNEGLKNPSSPDGKPIGSPYPTDAITVTQKTDSSQIGRINAVRALQYAVDSARTVGLKDKEILSEIVKYMDGLPS
jgi:hypothetical protein